MKHACHKNCKQEFIKVTVSNKSKSIEYDGYRNKLSNNRKRIKKENGQRQK